MANMCNGSGEHGVTLALGSNLGNRLEMLRRALAMLRIAGLRQGRRSRVWETKPWGVTDQPLFLNMCVEISTELEPESLLALLKGVEAELGRGAGRRWGPREIDIDIIYYDDLVFNCERLSIPHPRMQEREFVLRPLSECSPEIRHPLLGKTAAELLEELPEHEDMIWITRI